MTNILSFSLLLLASNAAAQCSTRPMKPAEKAAHAAVHAALKKAAPPPPAGWDVAQETMGPETDDLCQGVEKEPIKFGYFRNYSHTAALEGRQDGVNKKVASVNAKKDKHAASNAAQIAAIDKRSEAIQKQMETAGAAANYKQMEALGKEMSALYEKRAKLESGDSAQEHQAIEADAARDTAATLSITANVESVIISEDQKPFKLPGATRAYRQPLTDGPNPEEAEVLLLGPWKTGEDGQSAAAATPLPGRPYLKPYTLVVELKGDPKTARALLAKLDLKALNALLKP